MTEDYIRTERLQECPLCGGEERKVLYSGLEDRLFGAPGEWTLRECGLCGVVLLDPRPTEEDVGKAYATYYTHRTTAVPNSFLRHARRYVRGGYLANKFGYVEGVTRPQRLAGLLAYFHPGQRELMNVSVMYLPARHGGRLLEVGFGNGETLAELRRLGWEVEGVDFDAQAVEAAHRDRGLNVRVGTLEDQTYPPDYFDAVVMKHVIEHVHHPVSLFKECSRILKPGGVLIIVTPNVNAFIHRLYKGNWFDLDPPRHLVLFSKDTIAGLADKVGLKSVKLKTTARRAEQVLAASSEIRATGTFSWQAKLSISEKIIGYIYQCLMSIILRLLPDIGDELVLIAVKEEQRTLEMKRDVVASWIVTS